MAPRWDMISGNQQAWNIVPAHFLQTCFTLGIVKSMGIYFPELRASLGMTVVDLGLTIGLFNTFIFAPGISYFSIRILG